MKRKPVKGSETLSYHKANKYFRYDAETGVIFWRVNKKRARKGCQAGTVMLVGYILIRLDGQRYYAHRLAWLLHYGEWPKNQIDHIDQNKGNNKITNLRDVDAQTNMRNARLNIRNTSGVMGVYMDDTCGRWGARIRINEKFIWLGFFDDWFDAVCARKAADYKYGFHPNHGKPGIDCHTGSLLES